MIYILQALFVNISKIVIYIYINNHAKISLSFERTEMNPLQTLIDMYDSKSACALALGISRQRLQGWLKSGLIPHKNGTLIQDKTKNKIKAIEVWKYSDSIRKAGD